MGIATSYNMGWQKRSTGRLYDILSGHGFVIGCIIGQKVSYIAKGKNVMDATYITDKIDSPPLEHHCPLNWEISSGWMEATVALKLTWPVQ